MGAWRAKSRSFYTTILPVLVVSDDTLWVADYSALGSLESGPKRVTEATIFVSHADGPRLGPTYTMSHLHVYTRSRVAEVLAELGSAKGLWEEVFDQTI
jgi:hypothetical protein